MQPQFLTGNSRLLILRTMKKLYWLVPAVLLVVLAAAFFLLPSQTVIFKKLTLPVSQDGMVKLLTTKEKWKQWWPADQQELIYDSTNFTFQQQLLKTVFLHVPYRDTLVQAQMNTILYKIDSSTVIFQVSLPAATNPFARFTNYLQGRKIAAAADNMLKQLNAFAVKEENIYGFSVSQDRVKDTSFVAIRFAANGYPDPALVYGAVDELRGYIRTSGAKENGYPMLHAEPESSGQYRVMVAIPVDRMLSGSKKIEPKRMVLGNILVAEIRGGAHTLEKAMESFHQYISDHKRKTPAIPFESLVTDRRQEQDTAKWVTRLYYPVM
jgi:effector-binding domain-containing protein